MGLSFLHLAQRKVAVSTLEPAFAMLHLTEEAAPGSAPNKSLGVPLLAADVDSLFSDSEETRRDAAGANRGGGYIPTLSVAVRGAA